MKWFVIPGVRIPRGMASNCTLISGITPNNLPPPLHSLPCGDLGETSSLVVMLRNDAGRSLPFLRLLHLRPPPGYCNITRVVCQGRCSTLAAAASPLGVTPNNDQTSPFTTISA